MDDTPSNFKAFVGPLQQVCSVALVCLVTCTVKTSYNTVFVGFQQVTSEIQGGQIMYSQNI